MLAFAITVGPDEEDRSISRLRLNITCYNLLVLNDVSLLCKDEGSSTHLGNGGYNGSCEKVPRLTRVPLLVSLMEVLRNNVAGDAGESDRTLSPLLEAEVELIVLHPPDAANIFL
jgi:hypothetical protein